MLKKVLTVFIITISLSLTAQHKPFQFGFKAGPNIGWFNTSADNYKNIGTNFGGSWGFVADFFIMENYSFTTGFDVLYLNGTMSYPDISAKLSVVHIDTMSVLMYEIGVQQRNYRTKYIKLPLIFTMKTNKIKKLRYYGQIGFGLSFLLTAKANDEFTPNSGGDVESESTNIYDELSFTRESLILGAGIEIPLQGSTYFRIGLTYDNAFVNIIKGYNNVDNSVKNNGRNSFLEFDVCILF